MLYHNSKNMDASEDFHEVGYDSQEESEKETQEQVDGPNTVSTRRNRNWTYELTFQTVAEVKSWLSEPAQAVWSQAKASRLTAAGERVDYRCNRVKKRGPQCDAAVYLLYHSTDTAVSLYRADFEHNHDQINQGASKQGIVPETKKIIDDLLNIVNSKWTPGTLLNNLIKLKRTDDKIVVPEKQQIVNYLARKRAKLGGTSITFAQLSTWLEEHKDLPESEDEVFAVSYQINIDNEDIINYPDTTSDIPLNRETFRLFLSTKRLISMSTGTTVLQADSTYKLIWQRFPVQVVGTSDANNTFHPFGLAVCSTEREHDYQFIFNSVLIGLDRLQLPRLNSIGLLADGADAITNGFRSTFFPFGGEFRRGMCWYHAKAAMEKEIDKLSDSSTRAEITQDISILQAATSESLFNAAVKLFMAKWNKQTSIKEFLRYFKREWIDRHPGWYEGYQAGPSTNNGLEATNGTIKKSKNFRALLPLGEFFGFAVDLIHNWSIARGPETPMHLTLSTQPHIGTQEYTDAYQWLRSEERVTLSKRTGDEIIFYSRSSKSKQELSTSSIKHYVSSIASLSFASFEQYHAVTFSIWCTRFPINVDSTNWLNGRCSCPFFFKNNQCKHLIALAASLKLVTIPDCAKTVPIGQKRAPGRPMKARRALERMPDDLPAVTLPTEVSEPSSSEPSVPQPLRRSKRKDASEDHEPSTSRSKRQRTQEMVVSSTQQTKRRGRPRK